MDHKIKFINKLNPKNPVKDTLLMKKLNLSQFLKFAKNRPRIKNQLEMYIKEHLKKLNGKAPESIIELWKDAKGSEFILLIHKGKYIGSCRYFERDWNKLGKIGKANLQHKKYVKLNNLFIIPTYRRMGLGRSIMKKIIDNNSNYLLRVEKINIGAIKLYEQHGFKKVNTDKSKYSTYVKYCET